MEDILTSAAPPSRFFPSDLDNFAAAAPPLPAPILLLSPNPNPNPSPFLIVAVSAPSLALLHRIPSKTLTASLLLPELSLSGNPLRPSPRDRSFNIYSAGCLTFAAVQLPVAPDRARAVARSLLAALPADRVLVLDEMRAGAGSPVAKLETSVQRRAPDRFLQNVDYLRSGSVVDGLGAAVMAECEMRRRKGTLVATSPEMAVPFLRSLMLGFGIEVGSADDGDEGLGVGARYGSDLYT